MTICIRSLLRTSSSPFTTCRPLPPIVHPCRQFDAVVFSYLNQLHSKMICDENFGAQTQFISNHDVMCVQIKALSIIIKALSLFVRVKTCGSKPNIWF